VGSADLVAWCSPRFGLARAVKARVVVPAEPVLVLARRALTGLTIAPFAHALA
jgi:hypothetical protein